MVGVVENKFMAAKIHGQVKWFNVVIAKSR